MKSRLDDYIEDMTLDITNNQNRLDTLRKKLLKWGYESEIKLLEFIIQRKNELLNEIIAFKRNLQKY